MYFVLKNLARVIEYNVCTRYYCNLSIGCKMQKSAFV